MSRFFKREYATPLSAITFVVIALSGVMMYFHVLDSYVKEMHETVGLLFVGAVMVHVIVHWRGMKNYFSQRIYHVIAGLMMVVAIGFITTSESEKNPKGEIFEAVFNAPIEHSFPLFGNSVATGSEKLSKAGIHMDHATSIAAIAKANHKPPFEIIEILNH